MHRSKQIVLNGIDAMGLQSLARPAATAAGRTTVLLFHSIQGPHESRNACRERVRRWCAQLVEDYDPIDVRGFLEALHESAADTNALLVTVDDARRDILEWVDIFLEFGIHPVLFVPIGWIDAASSSDGAASPESLLTMLQHAKTLPDELEFAGGDVVPVASSSRASATDAVLSILMGDPQKASEIRGVDERVTPFCLESRQGFCTWDELRDLHRRGIQMGAHSVTHPRLAQHGMQRISYELNVPRQRLLAEFGTCELFAYPYGTWDVHDQRTSQAIVDAGYDGAFLVHAGFGLHPDRCTIPRIDIPDQALSDRVFRSLHRGAQIPLIRIRNLLGRR